MTLPLPEPDVPAPGSLLAVLRRAFGPEPIRHVQAIPPRPGRPVDWPAWAHPDVVAAFGRRGIALPWAHQAAAADRAHRGRHIVISTGTASGKSLGYQLPMLTDLVADPRACALYLAPTKALAADQRESVDGLGLRGIRAAQYDGDTPLPERDWARTHGRLILTNPDMLHRGILPAHARWARLLRHLKYVVVDECHAYRGVFGSHVALVLRRLTRVARLYGADPVFVFASATVANPAEAAARLIGAEVCAITDDAAPHPGADFVLWEPAERPRTGDRDSATGDENGPGGDGATGDGNGHGGDGSGDPPAPRRSVSTEAAHIMAELVAAGARTLTFIRSRAGTELAALTAQRDLGRTAPALAGMVSAYRGGYLPEDRRALERAFASGELRGVASTNALELGVDIAGIDAAVLAGYPGTMASMWQQAGRAGRGERAALAVFVARDDPLDSYLVQHPQAIFGQPVETTVTNPFNPYVLTGHLACAAAETRLTDDDLGLFGGTEAASAIEDLLAARTLRRRPTGYYPTGRRHPADQVSLRGSGRQIAVVEAETGRMIGTEDSGRACASVHPGAVYLSQGRSYVISELDLADGIALAHPDRPDWTTSARTVSTVEIVESAGSHGISEGIELATGQVRATEQVVGYLRRRGDGTLIDSVDLDLPEQRLDTRAVWYTITPDRLGDTGIDEARWPGSLHAAEHAAIALLPLFAGCDRWDIGGLSTALHPDTGLPTVIVYDGVPGGAGFAEQGYVVAGPWLAAVRDAVRTCTCRAGCPSCIQSPKCGNGNHPLDKAGAVAVLDVVTGA